MDRSVRRPGRPRRRAVEGGLGEEPRGGPPACSAGRSLPRHPRARARPRDGAGLPPRRSGARARSPPSASARSGSRCSRRAAPRPPCVGRPGCIFFAPRSGSARRRREVSPAPPLSSTRLPSAQGSRRAAGRLRLALMCARLRLPPGAAAPWLAARRYGRAEAGDVAALLALASRAREAASPRGQWSWVRDAGALAAEALVLLRLLDPASRPRARALSRRTARARRRGPGGLRRRRPRMAADPARSRRRKAARRPANRDPERGRAHPPAGPRLACLPFRGSSTAIIHGLDPHGPAQFHGEEGGFRPPSEADAPSAPADQGAVDSGQHRGPPARGAREDAPGDPDSRPEATARAEPVGGHRLRAAGRRPLPRELLQCSAGRSPPPSGGFPFRSGGQPSSACPTSSRPSRASRRVSC